MSTRTFTVTVAAAGPTGRVFYVSPTGNDTTGTGTIGSPWLTPVYGASRLNQTGDTLYIRAGTYNIPRITSNRTAAIYPRANNCTIAAYPGESVTLRGNNGVFPTGGTIGATSGYSGLLMSGMTIQGMVMFDGNTVGTRPSRVENCNLSVGGDGWPGTAQGGVIWIDDAFNVEIVNNTIHSNSIGAESGTLQNNALIMCYNIDGMLIERNTFRNSAGPGITMKDDTQNVVIRYNWFKDNAMGGVWTGNNPAPDHPKSGDIYQNVFTNNNLVNDPEIGAITLVGETSLLNIYNNTFHRNYVGDITSWGSTNVVPFTFFNNVCYVPRSRYLNWPYSASAFRATYLNFNDYFGGPGGWQYRSTNYATLPAWVSGVNALLAGSETSSVATDPGFVNASGSWTAVTDYKRASYTANGRGGSWPSVMGAYITGNEIIGATP